MVDNEIPEGTAHIWEWFRELNRTRDEGLNGPKSITYSEILAWSIMTGNNPTPWEVSCLTALDAVWLNSRGK